MELSDADKAFVDFQEAARAYKAADEYTLPGLKQLAIDKMDEVGSAMDISEILDSIREDCPDLTDESIWLKGFLKRKLTTAFKEDDRRFGNADFFDDMKDLQLVKFLAKYVVQLHHDKVAELVKANEALTLRLAALTQPTTTKLSNGIKSDSNSSVVSLASQEGHSRKVEGKEEVPSRQSINSDRTKKDYPTREKFTPNEDLSASKLQSEPRIKVGASLENNGVLTSGTTTSQMENDKTNYVAGGGLSNSTLGPMPSPKPSLSPSTKSQKKEKGGYGRPPHHILILSNQGDCFKCGGTTNINRKKHRANGPDAPPECTNGPVVPAAQIPALRNQPAFKAPKPVTEAAPAETPSVKLPPSGPRAHVHDSDIKTKPAPKNGAAKLVEEESNSGWTTYEVETAKQPTATIPDAEPFRTICVISAPARASAPAPAPAPAEPTPALEPPAPPSPPKPSPFSDWSVMTPEESRIWEQQQQQQQQLERMRQNASGAPNTTASWGAPAPAQASWSSPSASETGSHGMHGPKKTGKNFNGQKPNGQKHWGGQEPREYPPRGPKEFVPREQWEKKKKGKEGKGKVTGPGGSGGGYSGRG
ncbi:hypothetical protein IQ07DRAFT_647424 [Pyrenochaeta sp. DS3sAY3a]|nr:hypothetical protein IQ07DRAFT_647424 [Pyrenochaeta sp. DS3sAY3a]